MKHIRTFKMALTALRRNLTRAILTALGIIIGIASVIVMVELGQGSSSAIQRTISSMGANNLMIIPGTAASGGVSYGAGTNLTLTEEDSEAILQEITSVNSGAPVVRARAQVVHGSRNWVPQNIYGSTMELLRVRDWTSLAEGSPFTERDIKNGNKVCLIGLTLVRELFNGESPIGEEVRVQNVAFKVVGVLSAKGANMMGMDQDDILIAPWTTIKYRISSTSSTQSSASSSSSDTSAKQITNTNSLYPNSKVAFYPEGSTADANLSRRVANIDQIMIAARSSQEIPQAIEQITALLRDRHHIKQGDPDDFTVRDMTEMTKALSSTSALMTKLLLVVALISLIVGGVGIMNIMLVSVTERTREIGLRMAVGAKSRDILEQFLIEAIVLCLAGGILGIILGRGTSYLVTFILKWPTESSLPAVIAAFLVSVTVGLVFGFYPAAKAANLDPIEALRYE